MTDASQSDVDYCVSTERLNKCIEILRNTELGYCLVEMAAFAEVDAVLETDMEFLGLVAPSLVGSDLVKLNADLNDHMLVMALAHELGHIDQLVHLFPPATLKKSRDSIILTRIFEAATCAYTAGIAHELYQKTGDNGYLKALSKVGKQKDIVESFSRAALGKPSITQEVDAFLAAFEQWFKDEKRLSDYDKFAAEQFNNYSDNIIAQIFHPRRKKQAPFRKLRKIADLPGGLNYLKVLNRKARIFGRKSIVTQSLSEGTLSLCKKEP